MSVWIVRLYCLHKLLSASAHTDIQALFTGVCLFSIFPVAYNVAALSLVFVVVSDW